MRKVRKSGFEPTSEKSAKPEDWVYLQAFPECPLRDGCREIISNFHFEQFAEHTAA